MAAPDELAVADATKLLNELGAALHTLAVPSDVIASLLVDVARRLSVTVDPVVLQTFMTMEVHGATSQRTTVRRIDFDTHWRIGKVNAVAALMVRLGAGELGVADARRELGEILARPSAFGRPLVVACYGIYSVAVAARIGGGVPELVAALLIGLVAGLVHFGASRYPRVDLQQSFLAGLIATLLALGLVELWPSLDLPRALFGGITLLVPAMVVTIATHELAAEALESGTVRLAYGLLRFLMIGAGITASLKAWSVFAHVPPGGAATALAQPLPLIIVGIGALALVVCLNADWRDAPVMIGAALLAYGTQEITKHIAGDPGWPFLTALILGCAGGFYSRFSHRTAATVLVPGLLQLAPGFLGTRTMFDLIAAHEAGGPGFFGVLLTALQLITGLFVAAVLVPRKV